MDFHHIPREGARTLTWVLCVCMLCECERTWCLTPKYVREPLQQGPMAQLQHCSSRRTKIAILRCGEACGSPCASLHSVSAPKGWTD